MKPRVICGVDNGCSGSLGILIDDSGALFHETPALKTRSYTKKEQYVTRVNYPLLYEILSLYPGALLVAERPMINPTRFAQSISAARAYEALLIAADRAGIPEPLTIDSKVWQRALLPEGTAGSEALKKASLAVGEELYPHLGAKIRKHGDADGLLIAVWAKRAGLGEQDR